MTIADQGSRNAKRDPCLAGPEPKQATAPGDFLSTVQRGLRALEVIASEEGLPTKEVARRLGLPPSTAYHLVGTLLHEGYVWRLRDGGLILGDRLAGLLNHLEHRPNPFPDLQPILEDLASACGDVAVVGRLVGNQALITSAAMAPGATHADHIRAGARGPVHTMSLGKVLVAVMPPDAALTTLRNWHLEQLTEHTITDAHRFIDELEVARGRGYALDVEEGETGLCCVAAPIATPPDRPRAAIAVAVETERLRYEPQRLVSIVLAAARRSGALLGRT
jgi:IclR family transcriptional regulator, acetate operon repressor